MSVLGIVLAALATFIIGFIFHSPPLGAIWMRLANIHPTGNEKFTDMLPKMGWNLLVNLVTASILSMLFWIIFSSPLMGDKTWYKGAIWGAWVWLGFIVTSSSIEVIWMNRSWKLWAYECMASFVAFVAMGIILVLFQ
jgi:hypothetical protein